MPALELWPLLEQLTIKTKKSRLIKLRRDAKFAWAQREFVSEVERQYNAGEPVRIIVLKGRQLGLSTVTEAILFLWCFLHPGAQAMVLSKEKEDSEYLFGMTKRYWEMGPFHDLFTTNYNRQGYIEWAETGSTITTDTAKKEDVGRGKTLSAVHCSEVAFWPGEDEIVGGLMEAIPDDHGTICILESTAHGVGGYFHDEWVKAVAEGSTFTPMFFPWWLHDEYGIDGSHLRYSDLDDTERELLDGFGPLGLTIPKLAWRRRKLTTYSDSERFKAEYPMTAEEAFLSTGVNVFDLVKLGKCYDQEVKGRQGSLWNNQGKLEWFDNPNGHTWMYREPDVRKKRRYAVGVDPTWTVQGDPAAIQVLDRASMEQVMVWHGRPDDPETLGQIAYMIALFYGPDCILNTEVQGGGRRVLDVWRAENYPHIWIDRRPDRVRKNMQSYCWNSTFETKNWMIGTMKGIIVREALKIHHPATHYEMARYIANEDETYGPARRSGHDDLVISLGVALMTVITEKDTLDWQAMAAPPPLHVPGEKVNIAGIGNPVVIPGYQEPRQSQWESDALIGIDSFY